MCLHRECEYCPCPCPCPWPTHPTTHPGLSPQAMDEDQEGEAVEWRKVFEEDREFNQGEGAGLRVRPACKGVFAACVDGGTSGAATGYNRTLIAGTGAHPTCAYVSFRVHEALCSHTSVLVHTQASLPSASGTNSCKRGSSTSSEAHPNSSTQSRSSTCSGQDVTVKGRGRMHAA